MNSPKYQKGDRVKLTELEKYGTVIRVVENKLLGDGTITAIKYGYDIQLDNGQILKTVYGGIEPTDEK